MAILKRVSWAPKRKLISSVTVELNGEWYTASKMGTIRHAERRFTTNRRGSRDFRPSALPSLDVHALVSPWCHDSHVSMGPWLHGSMVPGPGQIPYACIGIPYYWSPFLQEPARRLQGRGPACLSRSN